MQSVLYSSLYLEICDKYNFYVICVPYPASQSSKRLLLALHYLPSLNFREFPM